MRKSTSLRHLRGIALASLFLLAPPSRGEGPSLAVVGGVYDPNERFETVVAGVEYRFRPRVHRIVPLLGLQATAEETVFAYAGLRWDPQIGSWILSPAFAFSLYEAGDGKRLGTALEFRSGLDLGRRLAGGGQVTLGLHHLSNGGLSETNPGVNTLVFTYAFPLRRQD